jgi:hypothetical protein
LEGGDKEAADETEDEDVAPHDWLVKKYNGDGEEVQTGRGVIPWPFHCVSGGWPDLILSHIASAPLPDFEMWA